MHTEAHESAAQSHAGTASAQSGNAEAFKADTWRQFGSFGWGLALRGVVLRRNYRAIATLRLCQWAARRQGMLSRLLLIVGRLLHRVACAAAGIDLPWQTSIGPGFALTHGWGTVVNEHAVIGRNVTMFHGITLGQRDRIRADGSRTTGYPTIEDEVWIGPHAAIVGPVTIGRGSRIAAGACVFESVPAHSIVMGNPATVVKTGCAPDVMNRWE
jgi:serine O-acetyltransferase